MNDLKCHEIRGEEKMDKAGMIYLRILTVSMSGHGSRENGELVC